MDELEVMTTEETSEEYQEVAEPETEEVDTTEEGENEDQEVAEPERQSDEQNSIYANMRRKAEADAQRKMDKRIEQLCKDVTHPITGEPIRTFAEYEDAIAAQNRIQAENQLKENGLDISILDEYLNSSPVLAQARSIIEQNNQVQAEAQLKSDFEELQRLNSDLKTFDDLAADPNFNEILDRVRKGTSLVDAYKIANFDVLMNKGTKGAHQAAINQARGKAHLEPTEGVSASDGIDVPVDLLAELKRNFPDKDEKQLRKLYKQVYK